ncbi:MAG: PINc/VapC family ATPase [Candidatus Woesearchaeota archaeon]|jgi:ATPase|nr:PINc/VapC family ATPase [Candidatus Woesearchaeota archaeon]|tara:strand:+ start:18734 stop:20593 length:1860 start_codon:yes stop_codon:yes gene_type:complete
MEQSNIQMIEKIVPDTSVIIEGLLSEKIRHNSIKCNEIIIHEAVIAELEHQANLGKAIGYLGLDEIKRIKNLSKQKGFELSYKGSRPKAAEIRHASLGEIDSLIRQLAYDEDATLVTSDKVQSEVALAKGMKSIYYKQPEKGFKKLKLERFFDETTMSVHLRENVPPYAKKGMPGKWEFKELRKALLKQGEIRDMSREIIEEAKLRKDGFIEIERTGSTIVQLGTFRIVITRPPFSDGWEITAVRPVKKLNLQDYDLSEKLTKRISEQADGILVAGSPGMGKTTFAQGLAEYYASQNKIVKTVEAPRDLNLPENVTQYAISLADSQEIHDILLLSRPDHTVFDEMRNTNDFKLFADLRLAGVGMVGVVHATNPIDAIQRFLGRIEMGVIPQVVDTVIFIKNGEINKVLALKMTVKVPSGMTEADLARPVVVVDDFESGNAAFEIYSYGEQTVVVPVQEGRQKSGAQKLAETTIMHEFQKYSRDVEVEVLSDNKCIVYVAEQDIARIIGKQGANIIRLEETLGIGIDIKSFDEKYSDSKIKGTAKEQKEIPFETSYKKNQLLLELGMDMQNKDVDVYVGDEFVLSAKASKTGIIKIRRNNNIGRRLIDALNKHEKLRIVV